MLSRNGPRNMYHTGNSRNISRIWLKWVLPASPKVLFPNKSFKFNYFVADHKLVVEFEEMLKADVNKVNTFFTQKEGEAVTFFKQLQKYTTSTVQTLH